MLIARPVQRSQNDAGEHLHVAGEDNEVDVVVLEGGDDLAFLGGLVAVDDWEVAVLHAEPGGDLGVIGMVADDDRHLDRQIVAAPAMQQVAETVRLA